MSLFLGTHGQRNALIRVPGAGFLHDVTAVLQDFLLAFDFVGKRVLNRLEGVDVLHLRLGAQRFCSLRTQGNIEVSTQVSLFHAAVGNIDVFEDGFDLFHIGTRFLRRSHIRLRNDLDERHTGTVVVYIGRIRILDGIAGMNELARVLLHVDTRDADALLAVFRIDIHVAMLSDRQIVLGGLEVFRQIRIVVVLAVKLAEFIDGAVQGETRLDGKLHHPFIDDRQYAGKAQAYRTYMGILLRTEGSGTAAENFRLCFQFTMDFQSNDCFITHAFLPPSSGISLEKVWLCS